tara:strand:+ start:3693 stop:4067 length:375 start_codon:yes stop_codon:yes gene_type:complete
MDYQVRARETSGPADEAALKLVGPDGLPLEGLARVLRLLYATTGLCDESGEVAGKVKKLVRDSEGVFTPEFRSAIAAELGDVLWYLSDICTVLELNLADVAKGNLAKLKDRQDRGVLKGSGDSR